jgi:hypothetical protein
MKKLLCHRPPQARKSLKSVAPKAARFYRTFNASIVYVCQVDEAGEGCCIVLTGGHLTTGGYLGQFPGEQYYVDSTGLYQVDEISPALQMSLKEELSIKLG